MTEGSRCLVFLCAAIVFSVGQAAAQTAGGPRRDTGQVASVKDLDVPILEHGGDGQAANCGSSVVSGLRADGDGFLAVRSGPGPQYRKIGELHNGDVVIVFEYRGKWAGVVFHTSNVNCSSTGTRAVTYRHKGWVHRKWLKDVAG